MSQPQSNGAPRNLPTPTILPDGSELFRVSEDGKTKTRLTPEGVDCLSGAWLKP